MEFNYGSSRDLDEGANQSSLASDRLKKAIERNRRKQQMRQEQTTASKTSSSDSFSFQQNWTPPERNTSTLKSKINASKVASASLPVTATRQRVARVDDIDFTSTPRKSTKKASDIVQYASSRSSKRSSKKSLVLSDRIKDILYKVAWGFVFLMVMRLVLVKRGVLEYYERVDIFNGKVAEHQSILEENQALGREIQEIKNNNSKQKKLVRDHLGFIANDEYLILFPKEERRKSI